MNDERMERLLKELATNLVWREKTNRINSAELWVLNQIRDFWPDWFDNESIERIYEIAV